MSTYCVGPVCNSTHSPCWAIPRIGPPPRTVDTGDKERGPTGRGHRVWRGQSQIQDKGSQATGVPARGGGCEKSGSPGQPPPPGGGALRVARRRPRRSCSPELSITVPGRGWAADTCCSQTGSDVSASWPCQALSLVPARESSWDTGAWLGQVPWSAGQDTRSRGQSLQPKPPLRCDTSKVPTS